MWTEDDIRFMREVIDLAKSAEGRTTPDPMVGAVLVKEGRIVSMGYHGEVATPHAEAWAIDKAGLDAKGATLYVNLEPCSHFGNNPPCADRIINAGIKKVYIATKDPNPLVNGRGIKKMIKHGIKVQVGLLEDEAIKLNEVFIKYITTGLPFVVMKTAITLDGKIATRTGASRWVAGPASLRYAHHLRNLYDAILVGVGTVLIDNPKLNVRRVKKVKDPIRIVLDTMARTPLKADILFKGQRTIIAVGPKAPAARVNALQKKGAEIISLPVSGGHISVKALVKKLGEMKMTSLLIEGGGEVYASFLEAGLVDKAFFFIVPKIFGGRDAKTSVEGKGVSLPAQAKWLKNVHVERVEEDILVSGYF
ncbi:MAG: bifunctional diaminohydroxyphosphoribosylaminopyrimidine deaminase/5-amino-6-(5-phosphoribosylamino)uracil reductase RibD [Candidatus Margulisbacteria bacterium]|nr:bifunctional diaminohydroxyphosphoribosylaminopyrimidine deaminase/5-amino-6-(5-phosphoribosylamino)uracil reductase RibD [Candidatus Margulisiibacteriota bacterium]MBU1866909.1 bifunctional diaminohydroxyphosphoribosylaminopyrimidine deaminase/5-amino-6-(5-phosphoribosylamino)uracil reductase RibD [Candidatus Margulisiibacteriota bacterium]